jgi:hypothetical protein
VYRRKRDLVGVTLVLIVRLPHRRWSLPSLERRKTMGAGGGAFGASLWVVLLSVLSRSGSMRNGMIYLDSSP